VPKVWPAQSFAAKTAIYKHLHQTFPILDCCVDFWFTEHLVQIKIDGLRNNGLRETAKNRQLTTVSTPSTHSTTSSVATTPSIASPSFSSGLSTTPFEMAVDSTMANTVTDLAEASDDSDGSFSSAFDDISSTFGQEKLPSPSPAPISPPPTKAAIRRAAVAAKKRKQPLVEEAEEPAEPPMGRGHRKKKKKEKVIAVERDAANKEKESNNKKGKEIVTDRQKKVTSEAVQRLNKSTFVGMGADEIAALDADEEWAIDTDTKFSHIYNGVRIMAFAAFKRLSS